MSQNFISQGQDGHPFLSYYDDEHSLSFVWDGTADKPLLGDRWIDVSHGGYGEPVVMRIPWVIFLDGSDGNVSTDILKAFAKTCESFVVLLTEIRDPILLAKIGGAGSVETYLSTEPE